MAITPAQLRAAGSSEPLNAFTMSLTQGWDLIPPEQGGRLPAAGDIVILRVSKPFPPLAGPSGWTAATSNVFWKLISPGEPDPTFYAEGATDWEIVGVAVASDDLAPFGGRPIGFITTPTADSARLRYRS